MKIFDLSVEIKNGMVVWPSDAGVKITTVKTVKKDGVSLSGLNFGSHTGTHIDAPKHFIEGSYGVDKIPTEKLTGKVLVIEAKSVNNLVFPQTFSTIDFAKTKKIILKTENTKRKLMLTKNFIESYVSLSLEAAKLLASNQIDFVGIDYLSVEKKGNLGHPVHKTLLKAGVVIAEGLNLTEVKPGEYFLFTGVIKVKDLDGAPARIFLVKEQL